MSSFTRRLCTCQKRERERERETPPREPTSQRASEPTSQRASEPASQRANEPASQLNQRKNATIETYLCPLVITLRPLVDKVPATRSTVPLAPPRDVLVQLPHNCPQRPVRCRHDAIRLPHILPDLVNVTRPELLTNSTLVQRRRALATRARLLRATGRPHTSLHERRRSRLVCMYERESESRWRVGHCPLLTLQTVSNE